MLQNVDNWHAFATYALNETFTIDLHVLLSVAAAVYPTKSAWTASEPAHSRIVDLKEVVLNDVYRQSQTRDR